MSSALSQRATRILVPAILSLVVLALAAPAAVGARVTQAPAEGAAVKYAAGWNIVAAPTGTELMAASGPQYAYGTDGTGYAVVRPGEIVGGRAVWAFFGGPTTLQLGASAATFTRVLAPADQWVLIGNPSTTQTLTIHGADEALGYDQTNGYVPVTTLAPGQGAWVMRFDAGDVYVGDLPADQQIGEIRNLQAGLTSDSTDLSNFAMMPAVGQQLLDRHAYGELQAMTDDLRAAFQDGLRLSGAANIPPVTELQRSSMADARQDLVQAMMANASGDSGGEAQAVGDAKKKAQTAEDDAAQQQRSGANGTSLVYAGVARPSAETPDSIGRYGALCIAATPALTLAIPPSMDFVALVVATLNNQPPPAASTPTPSPSPAPAPTPQPAPASLPTSCFGGTVTVSPNLVTVGVAYAVTVTLSGFDAKAPYSVFFGTAPEGGGTTDITGAGSTTINVGPFSLPDMVKITAATAARCGSATFQIVSFTQNR